MNINCPRCGAPILKDFHIDSSVPDVEITFKARCPHLACKGKQDLTIKLSSKTLYDLYIDGELKGDQDDKRKNIRVRSF